METGRPTRRMRVAETFEELRPLLFSISYRMLGSVAEAEDVVQDSFLRYHHALHEQGASIDSPRAYLSAVAGRAVPADQTLAYEAVAHPGGGRRCHAEVCCDVDHALWPARCEHDERP